MTKSWARENWFGLSMAAACLGAAWWVGKTDPHWNAEEFEDLDDEEMAQMVCSNCREKFPNAYFGPSSREHGECVHCWAGRGADPSICNYCWDGVRYFDTVYVQDHQYPDGIDYPVERCTNEKCGHPLLWNAEGFGAEETACGCGASDTQGYGYVCDTCHVKICEDCLFETPNMFLCKACAEPIMKTPRHLRESMWPKHYDSQYSPYSAESFDAESFSAEHECRMVWCDDCVEQYCPECAKEVNEHGMSGLHTKVEFQDGVYYCRWSSPKVRDADRNLIKRLRPMMDEYWMGAETMTPSCRVCHTHEYAVCCGEKGDESHTICRNCCEIPTHEHDLHNRIWYAETINSDDNVAISELSMILANMEKELDIDSEDYEDFERYPNPIPRLSAAIALIEQEFDVEETDFRYKGLKLEAERDGYGRFKATQPSPKNHLRCDCGAQIWWGGICTDCDKHHDLPDWMEAETFSEEFGAEMMPPVEGEVKVVKDVTPKGSKTTVEECIDIQAIKAEAGPNYYRVKFREPADFENFRVPAWAARAANTMGSKYYDIAGSKVTMGQLKEGGAWKIQSVMVPNKSRVTPQLALKIANHIQDRLEKEGKWAPKNCQDQETVLIVG